MRFILLLALTLLASLGVALLDSQREDRGDERVAESGDERGDDDPADGEEEPVPQAGVVLVFPAAAPAARSDLKVARPAADPRVPAREREGPPRRPPRA